MRGGSRNEGWKGGGGKEGGMRGGVGTKSFGILARNFWEGDIIYKSTCENRLLL